MKATQLGPDALLYLSVYDQGHAEIHDWDRDSKSPNFGRPLTYKLYLTTRNSDFTTIHDSEIVHRDRLIHVAEGLGEDDIYGTPRLEPIFNRLIDLERVVGASSEMYWRGGFPGLNFKIQPEYADGLDQDSLDQFREETDEYIHGLKRFMRTSGVDAEQLSQPVQSPNDFYNAILDMVAGATGIPKRMLSGSERGDLASSQDETQWDKRIEERRDAYAKGMILRPFIERLIQYGILPKPNPTYRIEWPSIGSLGPQDQGTLASKRADALIKYAQTPSAQSLMDFEDFLRSIMLLDEDTVKNIAANSDSMVDFDAEE